MIFNRILFLLLEGEQWVPSRLSSREIADICGCINERVWKKFFNTNLHGWRWMESSSFGRIQWEVNGVSINQRVIIFSRSHGNRKWVESPLPDTGLCRCDREWTEGACTGDFKLHRGEEQFPGKEGGTSGILFIPDEENQGGYLPQELLKNLRAAFWAFYQGLRMGHLLISLPTRQS